MEAHGTGTALGDPIEAQALLATYGQAWRRGRPLWLGSVKSNMGHTQAAAGVAGVIKMVMAMRHGVLPATLHVDAPSPHVDWSAGRVAVVDRGAAVAAGAAAAAGGGVVVRDFSGTNAHVILEEAPAEPAAEVVEPVVSAPVPVVVPVVVSAKTLTALGNQARRLAAHVGGLGGGELVDVAYSAAAGRAGLEYRAAVMAATGEELVGGLAALAADSAHPGVVAGRVVGGKTAFVFPGQGSQHPGMGAQLYGCYPVFAEAIDAVCAQFDQYLGRSLKELLFAAAGSVEAGLLDRSEFTQPAVFAVEVGLYRLVRSWGVAADFLIGHSLGEVVAAYLAEVLSLADACALVAARARLMGGLPAGGAMVAVAAGEEQVVASLQGYQGRLSVAALNSPVSTVVSGDEDAMAEWVGLWAPHEVTRLAVSHAFHSARMEPMLEQFGAVVEGLSFGPPRIPVICNRTGEPAAAGELASARYWMAQLREPVRFIDGVAVFAVCGGEEVFRAGPGWAAEPDGEPMPG